MQLVYFTHHNKWGIIYRGDVMTVSKAQQRATAKYIKNNYDEIKVRVEKGRKAELQAHAEAKGESLNAFMNRAAEETMQRDNEE